MFDVVSEIQRAQGVGTPIIALSTADQINSMLTIGNKAEGVILGWNTLDGIKSYTDSGKKLLQAYDKILPEDEKVKTIQDSVVMLRHVLAINEFLESYKKSQKIDDDLIFLVCNGHKWLESTPYIQGIMNIRDPFKASNSVLVLLGPSFSLPLELTQDIYMLDEPLPNREEIKEKLVKLYTDNEVKFDNLRIENAADALKGLAAFPIEQAASLSVRKKNGKLYVELEDLWERKRRMIEAIPGLKMASPSESFDEIGGLWQVKQFIHDLMNGPCRPAIIVYIDEIEKVVAAAGHAGMGDSSGVSQDQMQQILTSMEDSEWTGHINLGIPGSGKSLLAKAMASTYGIPLIQADFGAAKGSHVGESEQKIRAMIKAIYAMAGQGGAYFIATCNKLHTLSPELQRRFGFGCFMFELPNREERLSIGKILTTKKYPTVEDDPILWANAKGWSGANIRDCCKMAYAFKLPLDQASRRIIPAEKRDAEGIRRLREMANGTFLSASYKGIYDMNRDVEEPKISADRKFKNIN